MDFDVERFNLADVIRTYAEQRPDAPCVTYGEETLTYRELDARSSRAANALRDAGADLYRLCKYLKDGCVKIASLMIGGIT